MLQSLELRMLSLQSAHYFDRESLLPGIVLHHFQTLDKVFIPNGVRLSDPRPDVCDDTEAHHTLDIYDVAKDSWSKGPDFPGTRIMGFSPAACSVDGKLYLNVSDGVVYRLSEAGDKWEKFSTIENPRMVHRLVSDRKDRLLAVGGTSRKGNAKLIDVVSLTAQ